MPEQSSQPTGVQPVAQPVPTTPAVASMEGANTQATQPQQVQPVAPPAEVMPHRTSYMRASMVACAVLFVAGVFLGGYVLGNHTKSAPSASMGETATTLTVPSGASVISQCTQGLGTQYVLPKNIPDGPIYNVYQGKVIGLEFMVPEAASGAGSSMIMGPSNVAATLQLYGMKYDHMNVTLMPQGHAGLPVPHYMADVMMAPTSVTSKITCGTETSTSTMSTSM